MITVNVQRRPRLVGSALALIACPTGSSAVLRHVAPIGDVAAEILQGRASVDDITAGASVTEAAS